MLNITLIAFAITLVYMSAVERFRSYAKLIAVQGVLLFIIAILQLTEVNIANLIFILLETIIFKAILVPYFLFKVINKTHVYRVHDKALSPFYGLILSLLAIVFSIFIANMLKTNTLYFTFLAISIYTLLSGILLIISHKLLFSHTIGFLIIENGVFLLSIFVGTEMPLLINIGILLDIFVSVLIITIFINKIGRKFHDMGTENLTHLKN